MKIILKSNQSITTVLKPMRHKARSTRLLRYCTSIIVDYGVLLYNLLTKELILLSEEEYANRYNNPYLRDHWFVVPEDCNDKEYADLVKWVLQTKQPKSEDITGYTIFTTTDCNARCFYCFELGRSRIPMSCETAEKVVQYIKNHCGGKKVGISWFGGEPLFNAEVIDVICDGLRAEGVEFKSTMVSNGYLFDEDIVRTAKESWNLNRVQITLDGTEAVYNKVKAFIYKQGSAYERVMESIGLLLDAEITVTIRLNMDMHNAENLLELVDELGHRFGGNKYLRVYAHHLFKGNEAMANTHTAEEWAVREEAMLRLEEQIEKNGFAIKRRIQKSPKLNHCMADSGKSVTILPNGEIGLCEHFSEDEFIGHIDREGFDQEVVASWKERIPEIPECETCFYYPNCVQLKKCASGSVCFDVLRREHYRKTVQAMLNEYEAWKTNNNTELDEAPEC